MPAQFIEGKGEMQQDMIMGTGQTMKMSAAPVKKPTAAADSKKKWMRRI